MNPPIPRDVVSYRTGRGTVPFEFWFESRLDKKLKVIVAVRLRRLAHGLFGDCKGLGDGLQEARIEGIQR